MCVTYRLIDVRISPSGIARVAQVSEKWLWLARDQETREIAGGYVGRQDLKTTKQLWSCLPAVYRQRAVGKEREELVILIKDIM